MLKVGRYTAAGILLAVGGLLLIQKFFAINLVEPVLRGWPLIFVALGVEYLIVVRRNHEERPIRLDYGGVLFAVLISVIVISVTQAPILNYKIFKTMKLTGNVAYTEDNGYKFEKPIKTIADSLAVENILLRNDYGNITVKSENVDKIQVGAEIWVSKTHGEQAARTFAEDWEIECESGETLTVITNKPDSSAVAGGLYPRIDLIITVPKDKRADMEIEMTNGNLEAAGLLTDQLKVKATNGHMRLEGIHGDLEVATTNGAISATSVQGRVKLKSANGAIAVADIEGEVEMESSNGTLQVERVTGNVRAESTNGPIHISEVRRSVEAETTQGLVHIGSSQVGGDWEVDTSNGTIEVELPESADFRIEGKTRNGSLETDFAGFEQSKNKIGGRSGLGTHEIELETVNGQISIRRLDGLAAGAAS